MTTPLRAISGVAALYKAAVIVSTNADYHA